jgi:pyrroloquinoline quinone biosynthesis protein E
VPTPRRPISALRVLPGLARDAVDVHVARARAQAPETLSLLYLEITRACNAACGMCGYPSDYPHLGRELDRAQWLRVIDDAHALGTRIVSLGGGEPLLRRDALDLLGRIAEHGMASLLHTNGSLLTPATRDRLAALRGLTVALSLDSHRREVHDRIRKVACFDRVLEATRDFAERAPHVHVVWTFTITGENHRDLLDVARLAHDAGARAIRYTPFHDNLQHRYKPAAELEPFRVRPEQVPEIAEQLDAVREYTRAAGLLTNSDAFLRAVPDYFRGNVPHRCFAGFFFCSVDPFGNLFPCYDHTGDLNVARDGLAAAFRSPEMDRLRRAVLTCDHHCWNVGNAEPSLRLDPATALRHAPQLLREALLFLS